MALPPRQRQWNIEPPADARWFSDSLPSLQEFISSVTYALDKRLTRSENFSSQLKTIQLDTTNTNNFPLDFDCTLQRTPFEIRVAQVIPGSQGTAMTGTVTCAYWELLLGNKIRVHNITGLAANAKFTITLIIE